MYDMTFLNLMKTDYKQNLLTCFQEIACPKVCWTFTHPQAIQNVEDFVSSLEQIWRNVALHHLLTNGSSAVNGCRQNESPNSG